MNAGQVIAEAACPGVPLSELLPNAACVLQKEDGLVRVLTQRRVELPRWTPGPAAVDPGEPALVIGQVNPLHHERVHQLDPVLEGLGHLPRGADLSVDLSE